MNLQNAKPGWEFLFLPNKYGIPAKIWNPITGCPKLAEGKPCATPDGQPYCYMDTLIKRFPNVHSAEYKFHEDRLAQIQYKKPSLIGVGTSGDMWGWNNEQNENHGLIGSRLRSIMCYVEENNHYCLFLTKFPTQYLPSMDYGNVGIGTTVTHPDDLWRIDTLRKVKAPMRFVVFEPLFGDWRNAEINLEGIDWAILGSVTGFKNNYNYTPPLYCHIKPLLKALEKFRIPMFFKNNFDFLIGLFLGKQFPPQILEWAEKVREER